MGMEFTNIITMDNPASRYLVIMDSDDNEVKYIKSYNIDTKEAEIFRIEYAGKLCVKCQLDINKKPIVDKVILDGSKIRFRETDNNVKIVRFK